jgi:hypothetical protein
VLEKFGAGDAMERGEQRQLKQLRTWGAKFGLSVKIVRTRKRAPARFCLQAQHDRAVPTGEKGLSLDEIANELLKREKKRVGNV